jgi:parvulin-like peptidyl-prolyl isomerase
MCKARPEDFGKLVAEYSMDTAENKALGGVLGHCYPDARRGTFREGPAIYKEICKQHLQRGQISTPIATPRGVHIVRVDAAHPEVRAEFEQVKDRVERDYLQERAKMHTDLWLRSLVSQARIKRHLFQSTAPILENLPPDNFRPPRDK